MEEPVSTCTLIGWPPNVSVTKYSPSGTTFPKTGCAGSWEREWVVLRSELGALRWKVESFEAHGRWPRENRRVEVVLLRLIESCTVLANEMEMSRKTMVIGMTGDCLLAMMVEARRRTKKCKKGEGKLQRVRMQEG